MTGPRVAIVGATGRAAAASARRAGWTPQVVDLFADRDTSLLAETIRCPLANYPEALPDLVRRLPPGPVVYTGGLENHPGVIDRLAAERELIGNGSAAVAAVRDPVRWRATLAGTGWQFPRHFDSPPAEVSFLVKRRASSGGLGVRFDARAESNEYLEEFLPGSPMSAQFVDDSFLGATQQLAGEPWLHAPAFHYAGNIGPVECSDSLAMIFRETGRRLSLRGPWGVDFILNEEGPYPLEVNPRYTAAMEVLELSVRKPLWFRREAKTSAETSALVSPSRRNGNVVGKAVYYAMDSIQFPPSGPWDADLETPWYPWRIPTFADVPHPGEPFRPGQPVLTFFAAASTPEAVRAKLMATARTLDALFHGETDR